MKSIDSAPPSTPSKGAETWKQGEERVLGRDYFQFQYDFAKEMAERTGEPLYEMIKKYTTFLRGNIFEFDDEGNETELKPGVTDENMVDFAYQKEIESIEKNKKERAETGPMPYMSIKPEGGRFGCFYYGVSHADNTTLVMHFFNSEFDETGPLQGDKVEVRRSEFIDMLKDIKERRPEAQRIESTSWLLSLPAFRTLFPNSASVEMEIDHDPSLWHKGTIWGQFMDGKYQLRTRMVDRFLKKARELPLDDLVLALPLPPRKIDIPLTELYKESGLE